MDGDKDGILGRSRDSLGTSDGLVLASTDGDKLGSTLGAADGIELALDEGT